VIRVTSAVGGGSAGSELAAGGGVRRHQFATLAKSHQQPPFAQGQAARNVRADRLPRSDLAGPPKERDRLLVLPLQEQHHAKGVEHMGAIGSNLQRVAQDQLGPRQVALDAQRVAQVGGGGRAVGIVVQGGLPGLDRAVQVVEVRQAEA
jgi:hypothetical protein